MTSLSVLFAWLLGLLLSGLSFPRARYVFSLLAVVSLVVLAVLRSDVGVDYSTYLHFMSEIEVGADTYLEPGFELLVKSVLAVGLDFRSVFAVVSVSTLALLFASFRRLSRDPVFSLFLFAGLPIFYLASFNQIRQFLAVAIFAYALISVAERRPFRYVLLMFLASMFHKTALILLPMYFLLRIRYGALMVGCFVLLALTVSQLINMVFYLPLLSKAYAVDSAGSSTATYYFLFFFAIFMYFNFRLSMRSFRLREGESELISINLVFFASLVFLVAASVKGVDPANVIRLSSYFSIGLLYLVPHAMAYRCSPALRSLAFVPLIAFVAFYFFYTLLVNGERYRLVPFRMSLEGFV